MDALKYRDRREMLSRDRDHNTLREMKTGWWRRWESNPRPKAFNSKLYMLIRLHFDPARAFETGQVTRTRSPRKGLDGTLEKPVAADEFANVTPRPTPRTGPVGRLRLLRS